MARTERCSGRSCILFMYNRCKNSINYYGERRCKKPSRKWKNTIYIIFAPFGDSTRYSAHYISFFSSQAIASSHSCSLLHSVFAILLFKTCMFKFQSSEYERTATILISCVPMQAKNHCRNSALYFCIKSPLFVCFGYTFNCEMDPPLYFHSWWLSSERRKSDWRMYWNLFNGISSSFAANLMRTIVCHAPRSTSR